MWVRVFNLHFSDKMESCRHKEGGVRVFPCGCEFSHVGASFQLALLRQDEISSPQETWVHVFPCGCKVSNLHPTRAENIPPILLRRLFQRAVSATEKKGTKTAKAEARAATSWGEMLAHRESQHLAVCLIRETLVKEGIRRDPLTIHSDRGPAMRFQAVAQLLATLGVTLAPQQTARPRRHSLLRESVQEAEVLARFSRPLRQP